MKLLVLAAFVGEYLCFMRIKKKSAFAKFELQTTNDVLSASVARNIGHVYLFYRGKMDSIVCVTIWRHTCFLLLLHFVFVVVYLIIQHANIIMQFAKLSPNKSIANLRLNNVLMWCFHLLNCMLSCEVPVFILLIIHDFVSWQIWFASGVTSLR